MKIGNFRFRQNCFLVIERRNLEKAPNGKNFSSSYSKPQINITVNILKGNIFLEKDSFTFSNLIIHLHE
jgi:hypothetical protein